MVVFVIAAASFGYFKYEQINSKDNQAPAITMDTDSIQVSCQAEDGELYISKVFVDEGVTMKRMRPAPQGRGYRIRKRSNHVTLFVDTKADVNTNDDK